MKAFFIITATFCCMMLASCGDDVVYETITNTVVEKDASMVEMNRAALSKMDVGGTIAVVGHKSQDPDAVCSAIAMASLMRQLGMDAVPYMQEKPIQGLRFILDYFDMDCPQIKTEIEESAPIVLTDHNDFLQAVAGIEHANIVGIVDHHNISASMVTGLPPYVKNMNVGSCCTIVYTIYKECGLVPDQQTARILLAGIVADTDNLQKATATLADSIALSQLAEIAQIGDVLEFATALGMAQDSFEGMTDEEIFLSDVKTYEIGGVRLAVTSLDANELLHIDELCERMRGVMPSIARTLDVQMVFAKMEESLKDGEGLYLLDENGEKLYTTHFAYYGDGAKDVAEATYGATTHDNCIVLSRKLSRKTDIVPDITKVMTE